MVIRTKNLSRPKYLEVYRKTVVILVIVIFPINLTLHFLYGELNLGWAEDVVLFLEVFVVLVFLGGTTYPLFLSTRWVERRDRSIPSIRRIYIKNILLWIANAGLTMVIVLNGLYAALTPSPWLYDFGMTIVLLCLIPTFFPLFF